MCILSCCEMTDFQAAIPRSMLRCGLQHPSPRLPRDAPAELKKIVVDIEDPKRVYTIHHASRRHHFQILVDRYINQVRYGCQAKFCNTPTCFSCRKRLAGGAPVRRYNATSARTLAIYLASQDNPEQGLCQNPSASPHASTTANYSKTLPTRAHGPANGERRKANKERPSSHNTASVSDDVGLDNIKQAGNDIPRSEDPAMQAETETLAKEEISLGVDPILKSLSQPRTKDHKSFVQNVLETTPFKVLEWFAPRNLEILTRPWPRAQVVSKQDVEVPEKESIPKEEGMDERKMKTDASG
ncbi:hypothetical protein DH86_00001478, partial [Scytalidium sp. 3C]